MLLLFIGKSGVIIPVRTPAEWLGQSATEKIQGLWALEYFTGEHGKTGEPVTVRLSEILAIQWADENNLRRGAILVPGERVN